MRRLCPTWFARRSSRRYTQTRALAIPAVTVIPCLHDDGEIHVTPPDAALAPVCAKWGGDFPVHPSDDTLRATRLRPGWYSVHIVDAQGMASGVASVRVESARVPTVIGYDVRDAGGDVDCDGVVTARTEYLESADLARFVWTNGATTIGPQLRGVVPGTYAAIVRDVGGVPCKSLHACLPAVVDVSAGEPV